MSLKDLPRRIVAAPRNASPAGLLVVSAALLAALLALQGAAWLRVRRHERDLFTAMKPLSAAPEKRAEPRDIKEYAAVLENGVWASIKPPPLRLHGILGDSALFGASPQDAQPFAVGAALPNGDKIVEIRINEVVLEKDGKQRTECVFAEINKGGGGPPGAPPMPPGAMPGPEGPRPPRPRPGPDAPPMPPNAGPPPGAPPDRRP